MATRTPRSEFLALVADDDSIVCQMVAFALSKSGFRCHFAMDGEQALTHLRDTTYDLLVTDLQMPNKNGHALVLDVIDSETRPVIIVHTGVREPRLTNDLLTRGVDDVVYKPTDYAALAIKARVLVERRRAERKSTGAITERAVVKPERKVAVVPSLPKPIPVGELQTRLAEINTSLPLPPLCQAAINVYLLATNWDVKTTELAREIEQAPVLAAEVLKLANSAYFSHGASEVASVSKAIVRLGRLSIGEVALTVGGRQFFASSNIPWINSDLLWNRSLAAAAAARVIESLCNPAERKGSLYLPSLMHPIGRIVLATLFRDEHRELVEYCRHTGKSLDAAEEKQFGLTYGQAGVRLLSEWRIPSTVRLPLDHVALTFDGLTSSPAQIRPEVEVLKLSMLIGQIAVGCWEACDVIDIPDATLLMRHRITSIPDILERVKEQWNSVQPSAADSLHSEESNPESASLPAAVYLSRDPEQLDLLRPLLASTGPQLSDAPGTTPKHLVINGLSVKQSGLREIISTAGHCDLRGIVRTPEDGSLFDEHKSVCLPATVKQLRQSFACSR